MKKVLEFIIALSGLFLSAIIVTNCSDKDPSSPRHFKLPKLNLENASSIIVYEKSNGSGGRIAQEETNLYKLTSDGSVDQVRFINEDGTEIDPAITGTLVEVSELVNVNENYLLLKGSFSAWDSLGNTVYYTSLLVNKDNGAIYDFINYDVYINPNNYFQGKTFQEDMNGNIYYSTINGVVIKVDVSDPDNLSKAPYLPTGQMAPYFAIDSQGNCTYTENDIENMTVRLSKKSGGIYEFGTNVVDEFWSGTNGYVYYTSYNHDDEVTNINKITIDENGTVSSSKVWEAPEFGTYWGVQNLNHNYYYKIPKENSIIFVAFANGSPFEFFENDSTVAEFELPAVPNGDLIYSKQYFYYTNGTSLYKVSLTDYTYQNLLTPGEYDVYTMDVDDNDVLQISALRFSDGKKIIAEINAENEFQIIEEENDREVISLERLN